MNTGTAELTTGSLTVNRAREAYMAELLRALPDAPAGVLSTWAVSGSDALAIHRMISGFNADIQVLEVGTFVGMSALLMATHPRVRSLTTLDPNPTVSAEINSTGAALGIAVDLGEATSAMHVHEVAAAAFAAFPAAADKTRFLEGVLAGPPHHVVHEVADLVQPGPLLAFVDGLHTAEAVYADLRAILSARPDALVVLDDCRHYWGPFVQSGVARFLDEEPGRWTFTLLGDLSPGLASTNLAVVAKRRSDGQLPAAVQSLAFDYNGELDPINLLERNAQLLIDSADAKAVDAQERVKITAQATARIRSAESRMMWLDDVAAEREQELNVALQHGQAMGSQFSIAAERIHGLDSRVADLSEQLTRGQEREAELSRQLAEMRGSTSWRVSAPIRKLGRLKTHVR